MKKVAVLSAFILFWIVSCGLFIRNDQKYANSGKSALTNIKKQPVTDRDLEKQPELLDIYLKNARAVVFTNSDGRTGIRLESAVFSEISRDPRLIKKDNEIESYMAGFTALPRELEKTISGKGLLYGGMMPENTLFIRGPLNSIKNLPGIKWVLPYQPFLKFSGNMELKPGRYRVVLWNRDDREWFRIYSLSNQVRILSFVDKNFIVESDNPVGMCLEERVFKLEPFREPALFSISGGAVRSVVLGTNIEAAGEAERVSILDMGLDETHPDIKNSVWNIQDAAGDKDTGELTTHGTHLAGIIAGNGANSAGSTAGVRPNTRLLFYALGDDLKGLMIPPSLHPLLFHSLENGSFIANMSWGTYDISNRGTYMGVSADIDDFIYRHPEMVVVVAAGNNGISIASPATAKNVITVGALDGIVRAPYSGKGGTYDGRTKPDIMVQGSGINAPDLNGRYAVKNGTSQAAAVISGALCDIRRALINRYQINPTSAIIRGLLISAAVPDSDTRSYGYGRFMLDRPLQNSYWRISHFEGLLKITNQEYAVKEGDTLVVTLCWTDPPARENAFSALINDLDIEIVRPDGTVERPADRFNNTERVVISNAMPGVYKVNIISVNTPLPLNDIAVWAKSGFGFGDLPGRNPEENPERTADNAYNPVIPEAAGIPFSVPGYSPPAWSAEAAPVLPPLPGGSSVVVPPEYSASPVSALQSMSAVADTATNSAAVSTLFVKSGRNTVDARILGIEDNDAATLYISAGGVKSSVVLPVNKSPDSPFRKFSFEIPAGQDIINGSLSVTEAGGGENSLQITLLVDNEPPAIIRSYPAHNGRLLSGQPWLDVADGGLNKSGINPEMGFFVNGRLIDNTEYRFDAAAGRITFNLGALVSDPGQEVPVRIRILNINDNAGNSLSNIEWIFTYRPTNDTESPAMPLLLHAGGTNRLIAVSWMTNRDADLQVYRLFMLDADGLRLARIGEYALDVTNAAWNADKCDGIGLTAVDRWGNESPMAVTNIGYSRPYGNPEIMVSNVPEKTNGFVAAYLFLRDEGLIVSTNNRVSRNGVPFTPRRSGDVYYFEADGSFEWTLSVTDDDTNTVSNTISFVIDSSAPETPHRLRYTNTGTLLTLDWDAPLTNENGLFYRIYRQGGIAADGLITNSVTLDLGGYDRVPFMVSALDSLSNESGKASLLVDIEEGVVLTPLNGFYSINLPIISEFRMATNRFNRVRVTLSNLAGVTVLLDSAAPHYRLDQSFDIKDQPEGLCTLRVEAFQNSIRQSFVTADFIIDRTAPDIRLVNGDKDIAGENGNMISVNDPRITVLSLDGHYKFMSVRINGGEVITHAATNLDLDLRDYPGGLSLAVKALDKAGNERSRYFSVNLDNQGPVISDVKADGMLWARITDPSLSGVSVLTNGVIAAEDGPFYDGTLDGALCQLPLKAVEVTIRAYDRAGNSTEFTTNIPSRGLESGVALTNIFINGTLDAFYNTSRLGLKPWGRAELPLSYGITANGSNVLQSGLIYSHEYQLSGLPDGTYTAVLKSGGFQTERIFVLDATPPVITFRSNVMEKAPLSAIAAVSDNALASVTYILDGTNALADLIPPEGIHHLAVTALDTTGNLTALTNTFEIVYPSTNTLVANFKGFTNGGIYNRPLVLAINETVSNQIFFVNGGSAAGQLTVDGVYTVSVTAWSGGVNNTIYTNTAVVTIDRTPPVIVCPITDNAWVSTLPQVQMLDENPGTLTVKLDGAAYDPEGYYELGTHTLSVTAVDKAGNTNRKSTVFRYDNVKPLVLVTPTNGFYTTVSPVFSITEPNLKSRKLYINGAVVTNAAVLSAEGEYLFDVMVEDMAGNITAVARRFIIDRTAPVVDISLSDGCTYLTNTPLCVTVRDAYLKTNDIRLNGTILTNLQTVLPARGDYTLTVWALDVSGNRTEKTINFTISDKVPAMTVLGLPAVSNALTWYSPDMVSLGLKVHDGTVTESGIWINGTNIGTNAVLTLDGSYQVQLKVLTESLGVQYRIEKNLTLVIDRTPPIITVNGVEHDQYYSNRPAVGVAVQDNLKDWTLLLNGEAVQGQFIPARDGIYNLDVLAVDYLDRTNRQAIRFTVDTEAPAIRISGIEMGRGYTTGVEYAFTVQDANLSNLSVYWNGQAVSPAGVITFNGESGMTAIAVDKAGNRFITNTHFSIDSLPPVLSLTPYTPGMAVQTPDLRLGLEDTYLVGYTVAISRDNNPVFQTYGQYSTNFMLSFITQNGHYSVTVTARDLGTNMATNFHFWVDDTPPQIVISGITNGGHYPDTVTIDIERRDITPGSLLCRIDGVLTNNRFAVAAEGTHRLTVESMDSAGNLTQVDYRFVIDRTYPGMTITGVTNGGMYAQDQPYSMTVNDLYPARVRAQYHTFIYETNGGFISLLAVDYTNAIDTLAVTVWDKAGNSITSNITFIVDHTPPQPRFVIDLAPVTNSIDGLYLQYLNGRVTQSEHHPGTTLAWIDGITVDPVALYVTNEGIHTIVLKMTDQLSNIAWFTNRFTIDSSKPLVTINGVTNNGIYSNSLNVVINIQDNNLDGARCYFETNGVPIYFGSGTNLTANLYLGREADDNMLKIMAYDTADNMTVTNIDYIIDYTRPLLTTTGITNNALFASSFITNNFSDIVSGVKGVVYQGTGMTNFSRTNTIPSGSEVFSISSIGDLRTEGYGTINSFVFDKAGWNSQTNAYYFCLDYTAPTVELQWKPTNTGITTYIVTNPAVQDVNVSEGIRFKINVKDISSLKRVTVKTNGHVLTDFTGLSGTNAVLYTDVYFVFNVWNPVDLEIVSEDILGHISVSNYLYKFYDSTPPTISIINSPITTVPYNSRIYLGTSSDRVVTFYIRDNYGVNSVIPSATGGFNFTYVPGSSSATQKVYTFNLSCNINEEKSTELEIKAGNMSSRWTTNYAYYIIDKAKPRLKFYWERNPAITKNRLVIPNTNDNHYITIYWEDLSLNTKNMSMRGRDMKYTMPPTPWWYPGWIIPDWALTGNVAGSTGAYESNEWITDHDYPPAASAANYDTGVNLTWTDVRPTGNWGAGNFWLPLEACVGFDNDSSQSKELTFPAGQLGADPGYTFIVYGSSSDGFGHSTDTYINFVLISSERITINY